MPLPILHSGQTSSNSTNSRRTRPLTTRRPHNCRTSSNPKIIPVRAPTPPIPIPSTSHRAHLGTRQTHRLRRRRYTACIAFASIFDADVSVYCCWSDGESCECGGDAEVGCHAVVAEEQPVLQRMRIGVESSPAVLLDLFTASVFIVTIILSNCKFLENIVREQFVMVLETNGVTVSKKSIQVIPLIGSQQDKIRISLYHHQNIVRL